MRWEHSLLIDAPPDRVWEVTMDVDALPALSPTTMTSVERLDGDLRPGSRVRIRQPGQRARVWTVREVTAPSRFVWSTALGPFPMVAEHRIEPAGAGARNTLTIELSGRGSTVAGRLVGRMIASALATENAGFKRVAEAFERPGAD